MVIFPAIDLLNGQVVRLMRGDYSEVTVYNADPLNAALNFKNQGAEWLHIVDLDGAKSGEPINFEVIKRIKQITGLKCQVGGGIRDFNTIKKYIQSGIDRVILGTAAVTQEKFVEDTVKFYGEKIAVGVDLRGTKIAIKGWRENVKVSRLEFFTRMRAAEVKYIICTDISRDGTMSGTNLELYRELQQYSGINFIASGGVSSLDDIRNLSHLGIYGAIIGRAYYNGAINIKDAITLAN